MSRFHVDDSAQKRVRDLVLAPGFYGPFSKDGRYVFADKGRLAMTLQKMAVDTIAQSRNGNMVCIEEKIVRWPGYAYDALTLETMSCTVPGRESAGWMTYGNCDFLNYAMCQQDGNVLCHFIDFPTLKDVFWPSIDQFKETITDQLNRTACRIVPLRWIRQSGVKTVERLIHATPEGRAAVAAYNDSHYKHSSAAAE